MDLTLSVQTPTVEFEQIILRGCGLDVHKDNVVATIDGKGVKKETRSFSTFTESLRELGFWLEANEVTHLAMESTGVYWKPVINVLEDFDLVVCVVNARHVKNVPGRKTDKNDSAWLCKLLLSGLLKGSFVPPENIRQLRDLKRYKGKLTREVASEKNRIQKILEDANIKLGSVVSDVFGSVGMKLLDGLLSNTKPIKELVSESYHGKLKASKSELEKSLTGRMTEHHRFMIRKMFAHISRVEALMQEVDEEMGIKTSAFKERIELLQTIPGVGKESAIGIISETGVDMAVFPTEHHLASWAGMSPGNNETAGKKKVPAPTKEINT